MMGMQWDDKAILKKFATLEKKTAKVAVRKGVRAGRKDTLAAAKTNAGNLRNAGTGMSDRIKRALKLKVTPKRVLHAKDAYAIEINFKEDPKLTHTAKDGNESYIPFAIEYGHVGPGEGAARKANRKSDIVKNYKNRRVAMPKPFMIPAHESTIGKSFSSAKRVIMAEISKVWRK